MGRRVIVRVNIPRGRIDSGRERWRVDAAL